ncbi:hypothetical protein D3C81_692270 [compost metagenome]
MALIAAQRDLAVLHRAIQARGIAGVLQGLQARTVGCIHGRVVVLAEIALARHVLHHCCFHVVMRRHAGDAAPEQRHVAGQAQGEVDVGAAARDTPGAMDLRCLAATDAGMGDVGGTAAHVHDHCFMAAVADRVVMHGGCGGFFQEFHFIEAGSQRGAAQDVQRLRVAGLADGTAELHRATEQCAAHVLAELLGGGQADVFEDVRGDAGDGLPGARMQVVAQHRFGALHQVAFVLFEVGFQRVVAVDRVLQQGGGALRFADAFFHPLAAHHAHGVAAQLVVAAVGAGGA